MIDHEKLEEMLVDIRQQEDELLAQLNKLAGARDTVNHLLTLIDTVGDEENNHV
jgi:hypothetical protein